LHGQDVGAAYDAAVTAAPAVRMLVPQFLSVGRDPEFGWPGIAQMIAQVRTGNTSKLDELAGASSAVMTMSSNDHWLRAGKSGLFSGVLCADWGPQRDYQALLATSVELMRRAPRFAWRFWDATPIAHGTAGVGDCLGWPFEVRNPPHRIQIGSHPNVLVANTTHDSQTPLSSALSVWLQIPDARLLIADADGHQSLVHSRCAFEAMARFLDDPTSASSVTLCSD
jgi:hypothetical protein